MNREELKLLWNKKGLDCRMSITPAYAVEVCDDCSIPFDKSLIYTKDRYREQSDGRPRVDCEDLLIFLCEKLNILPDKEHLEFSNKMFGEGSRRDIVEEAYLGR